MVLQATLLIDISLKDGWSQVLVCGQHNEILVVWEGSKQLSGNRGYVVFPFLLDQVASVGCGYFVVEGVYSLLYLWCGFISFKVTFNPEFGVKVSIIIASSSFVPEPLESDIISESLNSSVDVGFREGFFYAEF